MNLLDTPGMRILHQPRLFYFYTATLSFSPSYTVDYLLHHTLYLSHVTIIIIYLLIYIYLLD